VHVWSTNLNSNNQSDFFVHSSDITPSGGAFSLTVQPGRLYSITTTTGQGKGTATSPAQGSLNLPYSDNFDSYSAGKEAKYLMDMEGAFETSTCGAGRAGMCVRQASTQQAIPWKTRTDPYALLGNVAWSNYTVSADVLLEKAGSASLMGRVGSQVTTNQAAINAYYLRVGDNGAWSILRNNLNAQVTTLRSGTTGALGTNRWHAVSLGFSGSTITASIDGTVVGTVTDSTLPSGQAGIGTSQGETAQFDNLVISGSGGGTTSTLRNDNAGRCLDVPNASTTNGTQVTLWDCNGGSNQQWTINTSKQIQVYGNKCLDAEGAGTSAGTRVLIWDCNGATNQQWNANTDGTITGVQSGLCLAPNGGGTANSTPVTLQTCNGSSSQKWTRS